MTETRFATRRDAQAAGWFSRRHQTDQAHRDAVAWYRANRGRKARQFRAATRGRHDKLAELTRLSQELPGGYR